jgi:hypothetical protein
MLKRILSVSLVALVLSFVGYQVYAQQPQPQPQTTGQYPLMERAAQKVIQTYQTSSCDQLMKQKVQPPSAQKEQMTERAVQLLRSDPQMRTEFFNRVAGPIANKLFQCGMIP